MTNERRSDLRFNLNLPVKWDGMAGAHEAHLDDISLGGCFVNTRGLVERRQVIQLKIQLPSGDWLELRGEVISYQPGIGFGVAFSSLTEEQEETLIVLMTS